MHIPTAILRNAPFTTVFVVGLLGLMVAEALQPSPWAVVVFYAFSLPYYLMMLVLVALSVAVGLPGHWATGLALCVAVDAFAVRRMLVVRSLCGR